MTRKPTYAKPRLPPHGRPNGCPSMDCRGGTADKQNKLGEGQIAKLSETAREALNGNAGADRCSYCGCVYFSPSRRILGFLDNYIRGDGWHGV